MIAISLWGGSDVSTVAQVVERTAAARRDGFTALWFPQTAALDTLTALAVAATAVPEIALGTAVVPIQGRHPIPLAQQALTVADAAGPGRLTLGIGVTHAVVSEGWYGIPYADVVPLCAEELVVLEGLLSAERHADLDGAHLSAHLTLPLAGPPPGLVVAALGPRMLDLAGRHSDGTVTWMTGPTALRQTVVPRLAAAAEAAGRTAPRVIAGLPVCVTDDVEGARERARPGMAGAATMPSYRRMLATEGLDDPVDLALIGGEDEVSARIEQLESAGATELLANVLGNDDEQHRTRGLLASRPTT